MKRNSEPTTSQTRAHNHRQPSILKSMLIASTLALAAALASVGFGLLGGPRVSTTAQLLVQDRDISTLLLGGAAASGDPTRRMDTYAVMAESKSFLELVAKDLGRPSSDWVTLSHQFTAVPITSANVLEFTVSTPSASESLDIMNAATALYPSYFANTLVPGLGQPGQLSKDLAAQVQRLQEVDKISPFVQVISTGEALKTAPKPLQAGLAGAVAGFVLGLLMAAWRHRSRLRPWLEEGAATNMGDGSDPPRAGTDGRSAVPDGAS